MVSFEATKARQATLAALARLLDALGNIPLLRCNLGPHSLLDGIVDGHTQSCPGSIHGRFRVEAVHLNTRNKAAMHPID
jgi:hypothetical protein